MALWEKQCSEPEKIVEKIRNAENSMIRTMICRNEGKHHAEGAKKKEGLNQLSKIYKYFINMTCQRSLRINCK